MINHIHQKLNDDRPEYVYKLFMSLCITTMHVSKLLTIQAQYKFTRLETAGPRPTQSLGSYIKEHTQPNDHWQMFYGYRG